MPIKLGKFAQTASAAAERRGPVRALIFALAALAVPIVGSLIWPEWVDLGPGLAVWILPLAPAFLLAYYQGWKGSMIVLAAGMVLLAALQPLLSARGVRAPGPEVLLPLITVLVFGGLAAGKLLQVHRDALARAREEAVRDPATGLPNRRAITSFLEKTFFGAQRGSKMAVVVFDIDRLRTLNDEKGRPAGDEALKALGGVLVAMTRQMNMAGRFGGDEFLCVLNHSDLEGATIFAQRVLDSFAEAQRGNGKATLSAGVAMYEAGMAAPDVLLAAADLALHQAKRGGGNRVESLVRVGRRSGAMKPVPTGPATGLPLGKGERILVVDDDPAARLGMSKALRRLGYSVLEGSSAEQAVQLLRGSDQRLDMLVTDINMPNIHGFALVQMMQELQPQLRVVYVSGYSQDEVDWAGVPGSVWAFVGKPFTLEELAGTVADVLVRPLEDDPGGDPFATPAAADEPEFELGRLLDPVIEGVDAELLDQPIAVLCPFKAPATALVAALMRSGFANVHNPRDIVDLGEQERWGLVVVDLTTVAYSSQQLLEVGRGSAKEMTPLLLLTEGEDYRDRAALRSRGLIEVLERPVNPLLLASTARNLLRIGRLQATMADLQGTREAAIAARLAELNDSKAEMLRRLARAGEYRDDLTAEHAYRVGRIASAIAGEMGWSVEGCSLLEQAATLHDVGKIAVPDVILRKPDRLTSAERLIMQEHTVVGGEILSGSRSPLLQMAEEIALTHHERWDGNGYPRGLKGHQIPEAGRIVAVADSLDVMTHRRPYRDPMEEHQAFNELVNDSGGYYDPDIVEALVSLRRRGVLAEVLSDSPRVAWPDPEHLAHGLELRSGGGAPSPKFEID